MTRTYGRSPRGARLLARVPNGRWETTTFLGAMRSSGFIAPLCAEGAINGAVFLAWVQQQLVASLHAGDVVVMKNPIELAFSKFKKLLRVGAERMTEQLRNSAAASSVCSLKANVTTTSDTADTATVRGRPH